MNGECSLMSIKPPTVNRLMREHSPSLAPFVPVYSIRLAKINNKAQPVLKHQRGTTKGRSLKSVSGRYTVCVTVKRQARIGNPRFDRITTNHAERNNLNVRFFNRRFTRKTLGYRKNPAKSHLFCGPASGVSKLLPGAPLTQRSNPSDGPRHYGPCLECGRTFEIS